MAHNKYDGLDPRSTEFMELAAQEMAERDAGSHAVEQQRSNGLRYDDEAIAQMAGNMANWRYNNSGTAYLDEESFHLMDVYQEHFRDVVHGKS